MYVQCIVYKSNYHSIVLELNGTYLLAGVLNMVRSLLCGSGIIQFSWLLIQMLLR